MARRLALALSVVLLALLLAWLWLARGSATGRTQGAAGGSTIDAAGPGAPELSAGASAPTPEVLLNRPGPGAREALPLEGQGTATGPARVVGTITRAEGESPIVGVEVVACSRGGLVVRTLTDARGWYSLELAPCLWFVGMVLAPYPPWSEPVDLAPGEQRVLDRALAVGYDLCIRVYAPAPSDSAREDPASPSDASELVPLAGVRVSLIETELDRGVGRDLAARLAAPTSTTDDAGRVVLRAGMGTQCLLTFEAAGFLRAEVDADFSPWISRTPFANDGCIHVVLEPEGPRIAGRVVQPDGTPLSGAAVLVRVPSEARADSEPGRSAVRRPATVSLESGETIRPHGSLHPPLAWTDAEGRFEVPAPQGTRLELCVLPERADLPHHHVREIDPRRRWVDVVLPPSRRYDLRLVDAAGTPVDGVAGVRDLGGRAHLPPGNGNRRVLDWDGELRMFPVVEGRLSLIHAGGKVSIGFSPKGAWRPGEVEVVLPPAASPRADAEPILVVVP